MTEAPSTPPSSEQEARLQAIRSLIEDIGHYLPAQHPLDFFIHHNTLHAFEDDSFRDALQKADRVLGAHSLRKESFYFDSFQQGRITLDDLDAILGISPAQLTKTIGLHAFLENPVLWKRLILQKGLQPPLLGVLTWQLFEQEELRHFPENLERPIQQRHLSDFQICWNTLVKKGTLEDRWHFLTGERGSARVAELMDAYYKLSPTAPKEVESWVYEEPTRFALTSLWLHCMRWTRERPLSQEESMSPFRRHRDVLFAQEGEDLDNHTHPILLRFFSRFCDQGMSYQPMPGRQDGLLRTFLNIYDRSMSPMPRWLERAVTALRDHFKNGASPEALIATALEGLQVDPEDRKGYLFAVLLSLRGWLGMIQKLDQRPDYLHHPQYKPSLLEAVALQMTFEWSIWQDVLKDHPEVSWMSKPWKEIRDDFPPPPKEWLVDSYRLFQCCLYAGITAEEFSTASAEQKEAISQEIASFHDFERCWVWHLAYEKHYYQQTIAGLQANLKENESLPSVKPRPSFQLMCCIDEREESFRRHAEEIDPTCETFGAAGFFGIDMRYRGLQDATFRSLCPPVLFPTRKVYEHPKPSAQGTGQPTWEEIKQRRRIIGWLRRHGFVASRMPIRGLFWALLSGIFNLLPMFLRILAPRTSKNLEKRMKAYLMPPSETYTTFLSTSPVGEAEAVGFTQDELVTRVQSMLRLIGLTANFGKFVFVMGHGSTSRNNPHKAAYDCGACGGGRGGPNARIFASTLNLPAVRVILREKAQIDIPDDTWFVGCLHDTCSDAIEYFEVDQIPVAQRETFPRFQKTLDEVCRRNAHERCRRFESAPLQLSPIEALHHVEGRSNDISEPRPEYGHATNAVCFVGRRSTSRGLFLDRRSFLVSYDPSLDPEVKNLSGLLAAITPVCVGINLEYFFSHVNNAYYGAGSKLPHNISGYLGVINGNLSDLKTGLPWQMVEIHEAVRLLMIIEQTPAQFERVLANQAYVAKLMKNEWLRVTLLDPHTKEFLLYSEGKFSPWNLPMTSLPKLSESCIWYQGKREHLAPVRIYGAFPMTSEPLKEKAPPSSDRPSALDHDSRRLA